MAKRHLRISLVVCFLLVAVTSFAKPAPPHNLTAILGEISELEVKFEGDNWSGARETLGEVEEMYSKVYAANKFLLPTDLHEQFTASVKALDRFLEAKDEEKPRVASLHFRSRCLK